MVIYLQLFNLNLDSSRGHKHGRQEYDCMCGAFRM